MKPTPDQIIREAETRYLYDPEFHARVRYVLAFCHIERDNQIAVQAAMVGVLMAEYNPMTGEKVV